MNWRGLQAGQITRVCVMDLGTETVSTVYETADLVLEAPNWYPGREELLLNGEGALWRLDLAGGVLTELGGGMQTANNDHVLSPDGSLIYASTTVGEIQMQRADGSTAPRRVSPVRETPYRYFLHGVSPDGHSLSYVGNDQHTGTFEVGVLDLVTGEDVQLTHTGRHHDGPEYAADGNRILFNSERAATRAGHSQLFSMELDGGDVTQLTDDERVNWFPHESPDGSRLVYLSYAPGVTGHPADQPVQLRLWHAAGEPAVLHELYGGQGTINVPSWSSDSRRFAFVEYPTKPSAAAVTRAHPEESRTPRGRRRH